MSGPQEASFRDEAAANWAYFDAVRAEGPESPAAQNAQTAFEITSAAAEQAFYREPGGGTMSEPEPGTNEWMIETGNYVDAEPDWDAPVPVDHYQGKAYPEAEPETGPAPEPPELEAGL